MHVCLLVHERHVGIGRGRRDAQLHIWALLFYSTASKASFRSSSSAQHFAYRDHYFSAVSFSPDSTRVAVNWMSRRQDVGIVALCQAPAWNCLEVRVQHRQCKSRRDSVKFGFSRSAGSNLVILQSPQELRDSG